MSMHSSKYHSNQCSDIQQGLHEIRPLYGKPADFESKYIPNGIVEWNEEMKITKAKELLGKMKEGSVSKAIVVIEGANKCTTTHLDRFTSFWVYCNGRPSCASRRIHSH